MMMPLMMVMLVKINIHVPLLHNDCHTLQMVTEIFI